jgi:hypothetical protein
VDGPDLNAVIQRQVKEVCAVKEKFFTEQAGTIAACARAMGSGSSSVAIAPESDALIRSLSWPSNAHQGQNDRITTLLICLFEQKDGVPDSTGDRIL